MTPLLSILVATTHDRRPVALDTLIRQSADRPVEVLHLADNGAQSIGAKRNSLIRIAAGDYVAFVDDDASVTDDYVDTILAATGEQAEVIAFRAETRCGSVAVMEIARSLKYPVAWHDVHPALRQTAPDHTCAVRRDLATRLPFLNSRVGSEQDWSRQLKTAARSEVVIPKVLYSTEVST